MEILLLNSISARAALILGPNSELVCPCCLVPKEFLWDLLEVIYPLRSRDGTLRLIQGADVCKTKKEARAVLLEQSVRNIPVCIGLRGSKISDFCSRIHSSTISADTSLFSALSVQRPFIRLTRVSGATTCGRWLKKSTFHLKNFKFWMTSRAPWLGHIFPS